MVWFLLLGELNSGYLFWLWLREGERIWSANVGVLLIMYSPGNKSVAKK